MCGGPPCRQVLHNLTYGSILGEDTETLTTHHFRQLVPLAQCALDYVLFKANATGTLMVRYRQGRRMSVPAGWVGFMTLSFRLSAQSLL